MSITTYSELQDSIASFLNRDDLTATIPTFIRLAEAAMQRDVQHWRREASTTATANSRYTNLPFDFHSVVRMTLDGKYRALEPMSLNEMSDARAQRRDTAGEPRFYALTSGQFEWFPTPGDTYTVNIVYNQVIPALSDSNTTNWVLEQAPYLYLYGALIHTAPYLHEDQRATVWGALHQSALDGLIRDGKRGKWSGPLRIR